MWLTEWVYDWRIWTWDSLKPAVKHLDTCIAAQLPASIKAQLAGGNASPVAAGIDYEDETLAVW